MKRILGILCIVLAVLISLPSCDGNVFVTPDISEDVDSTVRSVQEHLGQDINYKLEEEIELARVVFNLIQPKEEEKQLLKNDEMMELLHYLIPDTIKIDVDLTKIPLISSKTMDALLILDKPQDIARVNQLLSNKLENIALRTVKDLYGVLGIFIKDGGTDFNNGLIEFGKVLTIPSDYAEWTYGDYIAVQMVLTLILKTIPDAFVKTYVEFKPVVEENKMDEYVASLGDNLVKALFVDDSILMHVVGTYTFLNKYNPSTTVLDMKQLGTFFNVEEDY